MRRRCPRPARAGRRRPAETLREGLSRRLVRRRALAQPARRVPPAGGAARHRRVLRRQCAVRERLLQPFLERQVRLVRSGSRRRGSALLSRRRLRVRRRVPGGGDHGVAADARHVHRARGERRELRRQHAPAQKSLARAATPPAGTCGATAGGGCDVQPDRRTIFGTCGDVSGNYCSAKSNGTCTKLGAAAAGEPCGLLSGGTFATCSGSGVCKTTGTSGMGTCVAPAADFGSCNAKDGPGCPAPAVRVVSCGQRRRHHVRGGDPRFLQVGRARALRPARRYVSSRSRGSRDRACAGGPARPARLPGSWSPRVRPPSPRRAPPGRP